jgi:hypothetical protein
VTLFASHSRQSQVEDVGPCGSSVLRGQAHTPYAVVACSDLIEVLRRTYGRWADSEASTPD